MQELTEHRASKLIAGGVTVVATSFLVNHALLEEVELSLPGALFATVGAVAFAFGLLHASTEVHKNLAFLSFFGLLLWILPAAGLELLSISQPDPHLLAHLYLSDVIQAYLDLLLMVGLFSWALYGGQIFMESNGWSESPEAEILGLRVDENGIPLREPDD